MFSCTPVCDDQTKENLALVNTTHISLLCPSAKFSAENPSILLCLFYIQQFKSIVRELQTFILIVPGNVSHVKDGPERIYHYHILTFVVTLCEEKVSSHFWDLALFLKNTPRMNRLMCQLGSNCHLLRRVAQLSEERVSSLVIHDTVNHMKSGAIISAFREQRR